MNGGGTGGGGTRGDGGFGGQSGPGDKRGFICDQPQNHDCPNCISYRSCHDDLDNDGDDLCDCADPDCDAWFDEVCVKPKPPCEDGVDNDRDGLVDCADPQCAFYCSSAASDDSGYGPVSDYLFTLNAEYDFAETFFRNQGYPLFSEGFTYVNEVRGGVSKSYYLTAVRKLWTNEISGFIYALIQDDVTLYSDYISKAEVEYAIMSNISDIRNMTTVWAATTLNSVLYRYENPPIDLISDFVATSDLSEVGSRSSGDVPEDCVTFIACLPRCVPTYARPNQSRGLDSESEPCKSWEEEIVYWVLDFCDDIDENLDGFSGDNPIIFPVVKPTDDDNTGGGSHSDNDEEGFKDKEKMCSEDEPNQGGERSDNESFCHAVSEIKRCDPHGLGHHNNKDLLSTLAAITDSDRGDPSVDDEGMLSEVASYVCSQMNDYTTTQIVRDYTLYAGLVGLDNAISFEDYLKVVEFIEDNGLGMDASEFLATFDVEDCLATCSGPGCVSLEECLEISGYSGRSFCFERIGEGWTAVTTGIKFKWLSSQGIPPPRTITATITVTIPRTRYDDPNNVVESWEAAEAAVNALNSIHGDLLFFYGRTRTWNQIGVRDLEVELAELMEVFLFVQFGSAKVSAGQTALGVVVCKAAR